MLKSKPQKMAFQEQYEPATLDRRGWNNPTPSIKYPSKIAPKMAIGALIGSLLLRPLAVINHDLSP